MGKKDTPVPVAIEKEKTRRRWISLGELVAILAVLISGLTLLMNWSARQQDAADKQIAARQASAANVLLLTATPDRNGDRLNLKPARVTQVVQSQTLHLPASLSVPAIETTGDPRIEVDWFASALTKARKAAGRAERSIGDERLPVLVDTVFIEDGATRHDRSIYDIGYATEEGGLLSGTHVRLRGVSLVARLKAKEGADRIDALWTRRMPPKKK